MKLVVRYLAMALLPAVALGCQNLNTALDVPPILPIGTDNVLDQNPVWIPRPPSDYGAVYETVLQVLWDYGFEIAETNRYSGHVEAVPRIAPGLILFLKPGSPDLYDRFLSSLQTYRHRVTVTIETADPQPADHGGYFVKFIVRKELEDLARPVRSSVGGAVFRSENTVERQNEVIDATYFDSSWIGRGRDTALEQELIRRYKNALPDRGCVVR
jgi:hypothetical protein